MNIAGFEITILEAHERLTKQDVYSPVVATRQDGFRLQFPTVADAAKELPRIESEDYNRPVHEYKRR